MCHQWSLKLTDFFLKLENLFVLVAKLEIIARLPYMIHILLKQDTCNEISYRYDNNKSKL